MVTRNITIMWTLEHLQTRADGVCRGEVSVKNLHCIAQYAGVHGEGFSWSPVRQCRVSTMTILPGPDCLRHLPGVPHSDILDSSVIVMLPSLTGASVPCNKQQHLLQLIHFYPCLFVFLYPVLAILLVVRWLWIKSRAVRGGHPFRAKFFCTLLSPPATSIIPPLC